MKRFVLLAWFGIAPLWAGEMPEKAASYHAALVRRPESAQLFERFRNAWLEERSREDLEKELLERAEAGEVGAWATLARAYLAAGKSEQALDAFDKARKQSPAAWLVLEVAKLRMAAKDFRAAEKDALAVPEGDPLRLDALKLAGLACLRAERIDDALAYWTKAVAAAPGDTGLLEDLTELTRREGRNDLALEYCGKWRDATKDAYGKAMATLRRAELLLGSQRFDEAMTELAAVLEMSADDSWLERESLARAEQAHRQRGNATGWAEWIGAQADGHPARLNFRRAQAQALAAAGKTDEALAVLTEVMKRSPGDIAARWQRIGLLEQSMKLAEAYDECAELAAKEKSEAAGLRLAELAFRLEKKDELKRALDGVLAAADPAKRVNLAGLYARYGLPEESERIWREETGGEQGGQALRQLAKHFHTLGRDTEANEAWKKLGARDVAQDRMEAAQILSAAGERAAAREILTSAREKFATESGYEAALADLEMADGKPDEARTIFLKLARVAKNPDDLTAAIKGWMRAAATSSDPLKELGDETADRCLRAAWLAANNQPLPPIRDGDSLERAVRISLLREQGRWADVVTMLEAVPGERAPSALNKLADAKSAAGDLPGALVTAQAWRARVSDQAGPWLFEAGILEKLGKTADATQLLRRAAARFEDNEDIARRLFALLQDSTTDPGEALEWAWKRHDRAEDETARSGWLREILRVSQERNQLDDLQARFEERARRDPASPGPLVALADLAKARGDSRVEVDFLRRAAANAPRDAAILSSLAALEENSGEPARALERFATLARLAPGPESARQLAQAKIRLGDIEGGMRDMQALAGEKGMDLLALEQTAGDLASRGYVEEAAHLLAAVDPKIRTARLDFALGSLLDIDGREDEAADAYVRVLSEPADPAEDSDPERYGFKRPLRLSEFFEDHDNSGQVRTPGTFPRMMIPSSLVQAKSQVKFRLAELALARGGEFWRKALAVIPEFSLATEGQWREAMVFSQVKIDGRYPDWLEFLLGHPGNSLGWDILKGSSQIGTAKPDQIGRLLKMNLQPLARMTLRSDSAAWLPDNLDFLQMLDGSLWQDREIRWRGLQLVERMFYPGTIPGAPKRITPGEGARGIAILVQAGLEETYPERLELMRAKLSLLEERPDEFLLHINAWSRSVAVLTADLYAGSITMDDMTSWRTKVGNKAAESLVARIESPLLRCELGYGANTQDRIGRIDRELANLPADASPELRREMIRMKWSLERDGGNPDEFRKELNGFAAAADSDPRLAFEAMLFYGQIGASDPDPAGEFQIAKLYQRLMASPDAETRAYIAQYERFNESYGVNSMKNIPPPTRWGMSAEYSAHGYSRYQQSLPSILAMPDKAQATREAGKLLEDAARSSAGRMESFKQSVDSLAKAGLLEDALAGISLPENAGLCRRVAMVSLFDACSKPDRARALVEDISKARPWETWWSVDLALRTGDDAEMLRLLDGVAGRGDFDRIMIQRLTYNVDAAALMGKLTALAGWAATAEGRREWIGPVLAMLANGGRSATSEPAPIDGARLACCRLYLEIMLSDPGLAELGFRIMNSAGRFESPEAVTEAARRVLLSGAYRATDGSTMHSLARGVTASSALEHLVSLAAESGNEVAFPADFRERLKAVDPDSDTWLGKLLTAKSVSELPDLSTSHVGWVAQARYNAAVSRTISLPGRDEWLAGILRAQTYASLTEIVRPVLRRSFADAAKSGALKERVMGLLEAAAGPRAGWGEVPANSQNLPNAAAFLLAAESAGDTGPFRELLEILREERVPVSQYTISPQVFGRRWRPEIRGARDVALSEIIGAKPDGAFTFGYWQWQARAKGQEIGFVWLLPEVLLTAGLAYENDARQAVIDNPEATFSDLLRAWLGSRELKLQRRVLLKAAPELATLPAEIRRAVLAPLLHDFSESDLEGLPDFAANQLRGMLDAARVQRLAMVRHDFEIVKGSGSSDRSSELGALVAQVILDDEAFVGEIMEFWRPIADADKSGKETEMFTQALLAKASPDAQASLALLRLLDGVWKGSLPPAGQNSDDVDAFEMFWRQMGPHALHDPRLWRDAATLSPKTQARFWLTAPAYDRSDIEADAKLVATLREAAKGSEVTRAALEWCLQCSAIRHDSRSKMDVAVLLDIARALKDGGTAPEDIATLLSDNSMALASMENSVALMAKIPVLLDGLKELTDEQADHLTQAAENVQLASLGLVADPAGLTDLPEPVHPAETAALLKFILTRSSRIPRTTPGSTFMTFVVFAIGDAELINLWVKASGDTVPCDLTLILALLKKDRIADAVALAPAAGRTLSDSLPFGFTSEIEPLVEKLRSVDTARAFDLWVRISLMRDAKGNMAPSRNYAERRARITGEFERLRDKMTVEDRASICAALELNVMLDQNPVPAIDEFSSELAAGEFRKQLLGSGNRSAVSQLFVAAVCSRMNAGDFSGLSLLASAVNGVPPGRRGDQPIIQTFVSPIQASLIAYADRMNAKLPEAAITAILDYAKVLATRPDPAIRGVASLYVHLAVTDAFVLEAELKRCGLAGVKPAITAYPSSGGRASPATLQALMRVALLHPTNSQALVESLGAPVINPITSALLPSLRDEKLRASISPEIFLKWNRQLKVVDPKDLEAIHRYSSERRGDFDEAQRAELNGLLERWEKADKSTDPAKFENFRRQDATHRRQILQMEEENRLRETIIGAQRR